MGGPSSLAGRYSGDYYGASVALDDLFQGHTIPERRDQRAHRLRRGSSGGRPTGFDAARYGRRNEVEQLISRLKANRTVAMRFDKRAYVFYGTVTVAALRLWLCA